MLSAADLILALIGFQFSVYSTDEMITIFVRTQEMRNHLYTNAPLYLFVSFLLYISTIIFGERGMISYLRRIDRGDETLTRGDYINAVVLSWIIPVFFVAWVFMIMVI
tara:strand:+ start:760 stop:1083 length:324 start_codon:yes stop_codon:yes gene_type:complete